MSTRPLLNGRDKILYTVAALCLCLVSITGADLRRFTAALGIAVFGLLIDRVVSTWLELTWLERALGTLMAVSPLMAALATYSLVHAAGAVPANPWLWGVLAHRVACLALVVYWNRLLGRRVPVEKRQRQHSTTGPLPRPLRTH